MIDQPAQDDELVAMSFDELWQIIATYLADFSEVYEALIEQLPEQKTFLEEVFINATL